MAVTINFYDKFLEYMGDGTIDLDGDTFDIILMNTSHTFTATNTVKANISANEIATANGYTQGAEALTSVTWTESSGTLTFDAADPSWTASGGSIAASDSVIYSETAASDELMCSIDHDGNQTAGDGTDYIIALNASGIFSGSISDA